MEERKIIIEFTRPKNSLFPWFSYIIRAIEGTDYSHVRLKWKNSSGLDLVYEAAGTGINFKGPIADKDSVYVIDKFDVYVDSKGYRRLINLCVENAGLDYGVKQLLGICLVRLFKLKQNPFSDGRKSQVCSEVVGRFLEEVMGWNTGLDLDIAGVKDIKQFLEKRS